MGIKEWLVPQDKVFFDLLDSIAEAQVEAAEYLKTVIERPDRMFEHNLKMKEMESHCDSLVHRLLTQLNLSFITPIEHDDLAALARKLDDVVDNIYGAISKMYLFEATELPPDFPKLVDVVVRACAETKEGVFALRKMKKKDLVNRHCVEVNRLENVADEISRQMIADLYKRGDVLMILKHKEIIDILEEAVDCCEDVADILSDIVVKNT